MAEAPRAASDVIRFGVFELNLRSGELRKAGLRVNLQEQPLRTLALLLEHPGEVVTRDALRQRLWPQDTFVDFEHSLNAVIKRLRDTLGDSAETPRFVETVPRRGYRFIAPVEDGRAAQALAGESERRRAEDGVQWSSHAFTSWMAAVQILEMVGCCGGTCDWSSALTERVSAQVISPIHDGDDATDQPSWPGTAPEFFTGWQPDRIQLGR